MGSARSSMWYRKRDYDAALDAAVKINRPDQFHSQIALAAVHGQLGDHDAARRALQALLAERPGFAAVAWEELGKGLLR